MDRCARSPNCARLKKFTEIERRPVISLIGILRLVRIGNDRLVEQRGFRTSASAAQASSRQTGHRFRLCKADSEGTAAAPRLLLPDAIFPTSPAIAPFQASGCGDDGRLLRCI